MFKLAWRNLVHERTRLVISVGGVALAVVLILVMGGVFAGAEEHAVMYIKNQPAKLWLMQAGVENLHMASSLLPSDAVERVRKVAGVKEAVGLLYANAGVEIGEDVVYSYIFAVDINAPYGGPWELVAGRSDLNRDEVVIDRALSKRYSLGLGDQVSILGQDLTIAGLSADTLGIATSITFVNKEALALVMGVQLDAASYILVQPESGADLESLSDRLRAAIPEANLLTKTEFIESDKEMIRQMGVDVIQAMNYVAYVIGMLVIGLTIYIATVERSREYGVLKALGVDDLSLLKVVFMQAYVSTGIGFLMGTGLSIVMAEIVSQIFPEMLIFIELETLLAQLPVMALITALAGLLPVTRIMQLDPLMVFKA